MDFLAHPLISLSFSTHAITTTQPHFSAILLTLSVVLPLFIPPYVGVNSHSYKFEQWLVGGWFVGLWFGGL